MPLTINMESIFHERVSERWWGGWVYSMQASRRCSAFGRLVGWEHRCPLRRRWSYLSSLRRLWGSPVPLGRAVPLPQLPSV